jgi:hypothetical protein
MPVWPPVDEVRAASSKYQVIQKLDDIAAKITFSARPSTTITTLPLTAKPTGVVIKRERSDTSRHCLQPQDIKRMTLKQLNSFLKKHSIQDCEWLSQDFVPELIRIGEWRTYFVGGERILTICTSPSVEGRIICSAPSDRWSLQELTWVISLHSSQKNYNRFDFQ